jgi:hypothetical protein
VTAPNDSPAIPESFFELRQTFADPWIEVWSDRATLVAGLFEALRYIGVTLADVTGNRPDVTSLGDAFVEFTLPRLSAGLRVTLDSITFLFSNPSWEMVDQITKLVEVVSAQIHSLVQQSPVSQKSTLLIHVALGSLDFADQSKRLVNLALLGDAVSFGVIVNRNDGQFLIERSLKYEGGAFIRIERLLGGKETMSEIAAKVLGDETFALRLIGISEIP